MLREALSASSDDARPDHAHDSIESVPDVTRLGAELDGAYAGVWPSPLALAIVLHRSAWETLQASAAFFNALNDPERIELTWPAEEAEDAALTDILMLSCRSPGDAEALSAHLQWYLTVRPEHPRGPASSEADRTLIGVRLGDLALVLGRPLAGATAGSVVHTMAAFVAVHRALWEAMLSPPGRHEASDEVRALYAQAADAMADRAADAVLVAPCANREDAAAFVAHAQWYAAELVVAGDHFADGFGYSARQMAARAGDLALYLGNR